jgi:S-formylglutathione hydrolase FrmB
MKGRLEELEVASRALEGNPLGDPSRRPLLVYLPPGHRPGAQLPSVTFLHGMGGGVRSWTNFSAFVPTVPERLDALVSQGRIPPVIGVFPDGSTSVGGTQWMNSPGVGRYGDYVIEDVLPPVESRFGAIPRPESRAVVGKSSGGYGALALTRNHPGTFSHVGAHAADAAFEYCYLPDFPLAAAALLGTDPEAWLREMRRRAGETKLRAEDPPVLNAIAMAAHYSPRQGAPLGLELPFEPGTARIRPEIWARWLEHDPVRFVPAHPDPFRRLRSLFVDCGTRDEFHLRWGARMLVESLRAAGIEVVHEEFEDGHRDTGYRFERSLAYLVPRMER